MCGIRLRCPTASSALKSQRHLSTAAHAAPSLDSATGGARARGQNRFALFFLSTRKNNICSSQFANWEQQVSTGHLHLYGFDSRLRSKINAQTPYGVCIRNFFATGIDLHFSSSQRGRKISVAPSLRTGSSKCPPDTCIYMGSILGCGAK